MKRPWNQYPFVLRRKILLTFLAGFASIAVSLVIFTVTADRILLALGGIICLSSLILSKSLWDTAALGRYEIIEGICTGVSTPMLRRCRKVHLADDQGVEFTLLLDKSVRFQTGARYRFYFHKGSRPSVGNDYLDAALSTHNFLGYELAESLSAPPAYTTDDQAPSQK